MPAADERIFEAFYTTKTTGLGMGLSGAKRLVNDFEIETKVGAGTRVTITRWK